MGIAQFPGGAPFFKYRNATTALSHLSSKGNDIISCKGIQNIPSNVRNALTVLQYSKINKKSNRIARQNTIIEEVIDHQAHALLLKQSSR